MPRDLSTAARAAAAVAPRASVASERIVVLGLGYVGLPVASAFSRVCDSVVGFDISDARIRALAAGHDATGELDRETLLSSPVRFTADPADLRGGTFFVVTVPTPVDREHRPDLRPLAGACEAVAPHLTPGAVVVFESTVFPGATEEVCGPLLERGSGLACGRDFTLGYSPERLNPGDRAHGLETITKVVAGQDEATLERVAAAYEAIVPAGVHRAPSIRVAEAAKVIENIQRDVNIALMNELALVFDRLGLPTRDVLAAAGTKWNFLKFTPGLVGGHCIGVDPYYLTAKAESVGYHPEVILSGRRINDGMGRFVAQKTLRLMAGAGLQTTGARVGVLGLTFKENVPDLRNSKVVDIVAELRGFGVDPMVHDALAARERAADEYGIELSDLAAFEALDALVVAVPHEAYRADPDRLFRMLRPGGVLVDVKGMLEAGSVPEHLRYWALC